jgi:protein TonB
VPGHGGALLALARPGEGPGGVPAEYAPYLARFRQRVEEALVYPLAARRRGHAGRVELEILLEPSGRVERVEVTVSSSNAALDAAAVDAVKAVKPIPLPDDLPRRPLLVRLPLVFHLR